MRIAVVIPGHLRDYKKTAKSLFKLIGNNCDIFIPTWETLYGNCKCNTCLAQKEHLPSIQTSTQLNEINKTYNAKQVIIEPYHTKYTSIKSYATSIQLNNQDAIGFFGGNLVEFCSMLYLWKKSKEMVEEYEKKNNFQYDLIIRVRSDVIFDSSLQLDKLHLAANSIFLPNCFTYYGELGVNDQFALGSNAAMKCYLSFYDSVINYIFQRAIKEPRPEKLLRHHLTSNGLLVTPVEMRYYILRNDNVLYASPWGGHHDNGSLSLIKHLI